MLFPEADVEPAPSMKSAIESFSLELRVKIYEKLSTGHGGVRMQDKILISGFDPFGGEPVNPACELLRILDGKLLDGYRIVTQEIPTARFRAAETLCLAITREDPAMILALGQSGGCSELSVERVAINVDDYRIPDNDGNQPVDEPVVEGGPVAYWSTLPIRSMVRAMREVEVPASISNSAGTFVCNHLFYSLMRFLEEEGDVRRGGFIHVPYMLEQAERLGQPGLPLEVMARGLEAAVRAAAAVCKGH